MTHIAGLKLRGKEYEIYIDEEGKYFARRFEDGVLLKDDPVVNTEIEDAESDNEAITRLIDWVVPEDDFEELYYEEDMTYA